MGAGGPPSQRATSARTAPGGSRAKLDRNSVGAGSATLLPSLGVSGSGYQRPGGAPGSRPPGLPLAASQSAFNSRRMGDINAKENKNTAVITIDDL